jgi:hypothetical protein
VGPKWSMIKQKLTIEQFNFYLITTAPTIFKLGMMHFWGKGDIHCEFHNTFPWGLWEEAKSGGKNDQFKKKFSEITCMLKKKPNKQANKNKTKCMVIW